MSGARRQGVLVAELQRSVRRTLAPVLQRHRNLATFRDDVAQLLAEVEMEEQLRGAFIVNEMPWSAQDMMHATGACRKRVMSAMQAFSLPKKLPREVIRDLVFAAWNSEEVLSLEPSLRCQCYGCGRFRDAGTPCENKECHVPGWNLPYP